MPERTRTKLSPEEERKFQSWYRSWAIRIGIDQNPDHPLHKYDYRGSYKAGLGPTPDKGGAYHWPSQYKDYDHPNRYVDGIDTITGKPMKDISWRS